MNDSPTFSIHVDESLLLQARSILSKAGLTEFDVVRELLHTIVRDGRPPAELMQASAVRGSSRFREAERFSSGPMAEASLLQATEVEHPKELPVGPKNSLVNPPASSTVDAVEATSLYYPPHQNQPPVGHESWLEYVASTFDARPALAHLMFEDGYRDECNSVQIKVHEELNALRAAAGLPPLLPKGGVRTVLEEQTAAGERSEGSIRRVKG
ncbi:hypothetical protein [Variovorax atrisoli]|uniref:hypothetical protein n=1 Tax=Variovorax atrisoli TaxID=3394203 RepID=UPI0012FD7425|nr:hypothetical protein [Variovorax paradoxus]